MPFACGRKSKEEEKKSSINLDVASGIKDHPSLPPAAVSCCQGDIRTAPRESFTLSKREKKKPTGNCLFMFCFVFFRFIFRQRGMTGNLNTIEKKPVVVKLSALVSFFRAQSSSSSPCVCARPSKCQQYTRQTVRHAQGEDGADVSTSIIDPFLPSVSHQGPSVLCVCVRASGEDDVRCFHPRPTYSERGPLNGQTN